MKNGSKHTKTAEGQTEDQTVGPKIFLKFPFRLKELFKEQ
jgi:hypothetical protein